ncbi:MAG: thiolase family protein [Acidimicrobiia bacterium]|nr:thiolase family protein [Acidimicrobiia bacterium]
MSSDGRVVVAGVGMTNFGKFLDRGLKSLSVEAVSGALADAGLEPGDVQLAVVGNAVAGLITGQECIRGQVVLRESGIGGIPIFNVENACASASSAFHLAWQQVVTGQVDVALALGVEKLTHPDKRLSLTAFNAAIDVELLAQVKEALESSSRQASEKAADGSSGPGEGGGSRSLFMDVYSAAVRVHMDRYGTTQEQMAKVAVKSHKFGALNPRAQYRDEVTLEEVLASREVSYPLTLLMCSPIGDGAAAAVIVSDAYARARGLRGPRVAASVVRSGNLPGSEDESSETRAGLAAYEMSGIGPDELDVAEVHDATAPAEILAYEDLGLCPRGEGGKLVDQGETDLGGRIPVNTSGGLCSKGHPVGATGLAQIAEITWQLRGECGARQVEGARIGLTQNGGGFLGNDAAAQAVHILVG